MSSHKIDAQRRELARRVRQTSIEEFHDQLAEAGVTRAFIVSENGEISLSHPGLLSPVRAFFELSQDFADHEGIFIGREEGIPTLFFAAVHDTRRGLGQGGLRFKPYDNMADVLVDGLRLARGMTRKNALAGLWWGGGKGIVATSASLRTPDYLTEGTEQRLELFRAYGRFIASLGGLYYTAEDVGTKTSDMNAILGQNRFTTCVGSELGGSGNPSKATARGVFVAIQAAWRFLTGSDELTDVKVAVQGVGNVGGPLVALLDDAGARIWVTDINQPALAALKRDRPRIEIVASNDIFDLDSDIFAPCAIGAQVNARTIPRLKARLVCGAANNILGEDADAERLRQRGIAYVPDYLCNRMGITNCADEWQGYLRHDVQLAAERVYPDTLRVLKHARSQMITTAAAADQLADIAATELHPLIGHRGRRIIDALIASGWHGGRGSRARQLDQKKADDRPTVPTAFVPGADEPALRVRWEREGRFRGQGKTLAAAPISAAGRPDLSSLLSALMMDVRARAIELTGAPRPRRLVGSDPGGLSLQLAVEGSLPFDRDEIGRPRFVERCADVHRSHDAAIRDQLHQLGAGFDPDAWIDPMSHDGMRASRRLYFALEDAGLITREKRLSYYDPTTQTVLVSPDVIRTQVEVHERFVVSFTTSGYKPEVIEAQTFFPELLPGAVAIAVRRDGPYGHLDGCEALDPFGRANLPVHAFSKLTTDAKFLVPAHDRADEALANAKGIGHRRVVIDAHGRFLLSDGTPWIREEARRRVCEHLGERIERSTGRFEVEAFRARGSGTLVNLGTSQQVFVHLDKATARLRLAIDNGTVRFSDDRWRHRALELLADPEPWCISRQYWWGHALPRSEDEVLSVWFSLVASTLSAAGWPTDPEPEPIDELYTDNERLSRWVLPCQLVSLALTGRPAFRQTRVHGGLQFLERVLEERPDLDDEKASLDQVFDEERFVVRWIRRPMRPGLSNAIEPAALIRRFGADALRLGYLLSLHTGSMDLATAAESHLRRARRTVHRLSSKVTGLFHLTRDATEGGPARLADAWILNRADAASQAARSAYDELRLADAGRLLPTVIDELARYATLAAGRDQRGDDLDSIRATVSAVIHKLAAGFSPVCPYSFEKLTTWTQARSNSNIEGPPWVSALIEQLRKGSAGEVEVGSSNAEVLTWLRRDHQELEALAGRTVTLVNELHEGTAVGPCIVRLPTA